MINVTELGWNVTTVGELDHRLLKAPTVKLRSFTEGPNGGVVYSVDLRINRPNTTFLTTTELHSVEHFLLAGFRKYLPENFISVGIMGCQTGFYLILFNEGNAEKICEVYKTILTEMLTADKVPYASIQECGNYLNHSLEHAQAVARRVLEAEPHWLQVT